MHRTVLITGATDGLGLGVAERAAAEGNRVILHGRSAERLTAAAERIEQKIGVRPPAVQGDFARLADVASVVDQLVEITSHLDILINNAAVGPGEPDDRKRIETGDGFELRFAVNYLAPFALTLRLLPFLQRGSEPRVVNVASDGQASLDFDNLMLTRGYSSEQAYCQSKLALITFGFKLAERSDVAVSSLHPGSSMPTKMVIGKSIVDDLEGGIDAVYRLACDPAFAGVSGRYFVRLREDRALDLAYDPEFQDRLWTESLALTEAPRTA